jgi:hypothetical protein
MSGIPTTFNNWNMRSLLEARWASFFDTLGWNYEYEPFELPGWIPDFALKGKDNTLLLDIKPIFDDPDEAIRNKLAKAVEGTKYIAGIVRACPFIYEDCLWCIGDSVYWMDDDGKPFVMDEDLCICFSNGNYGLSSYTQGWHDLINGGGGKEIWNGMYTNESTEIPIMWRRACNRVQWRAPQ